MTISSMTQQSRGVSLVEALVALAIMAFGMMAYVGVQNTLRLNGDVARQRSEATRIAQQALDEWRSFTVIDSAVGQKAWADIGSQAALVVAGQVANTSYVLTRNVTTSGAPAIKTLFVSVRWEDRVGQIQQVLLSSVVAAAAPGLSGALAVAPGATSPVKRPRSRHPTIPLLAKELGNGRSVFRPDPSVGWVFDNVTGNIIGICELQPDVPTESLTAAALDQCSSNTLAQFVSGFVRFKRSEVFGFSHISAADAEDPPGPPLNLVVHLELTSSGHPGSPACFDDAPLRASVASHMRYVSYNCIVPSNSVQLWSGRTTIVPRDPLEPDQDFIRWDINTSGQFGTYIVCRYTPAASDEVAVPNADHPAHYNLVAGNLVSQNFLLVRGNCPTDVPANPAAGDFVNTNTLQHQPEPD